MLINGTSCKRTTVWWDVVDLAASSSCETFEHAPLRQTESTLLCKDYDRERLDATV